ncbi:hypothetical protein NDU88_007176 [Pleurodeles waltl]|uniref:Uncharacterized protein n=1 Tax=Pleurodeles waltl TaxID=8319 RepID=A0AAV7LRA6_PLEWA|nr:hypothetical protein NDU88_007176 [Pleurodeles waltl]
MVCIAVVPGGLIRLMNPAVSVVSLVVGSLRDVFEDGMDLMVAGSLDAGNTEEVSDEELTTHADAGVRSKPMSNEP